MFLFHSTCPIVFTLARFCTFTIKWQFNCLVEHVFKKKYLTLIRLIFVQSSYIILFSKTSETIIYIYIKKCSYLWKFCQNVSSCLESIFSFSLPVRRKPEKAYCSQTQWHLVDFFSITQLNQVVEMDQSGWVKLTTLINEIYWLKMCSAKQLHRTRWSCFTLCEWPMVENW